MEAALAAALAALAALSPLYYNVTITLDGGSPAALVLRVEPLGPAGSSLWMLLSYHTSGSLDREALTLLALLGLRPGLLGAPLHGRPAAPIPVYHDPDTLPPSRILEKRLAGVKITLHYDSHGWLEWARASGRLGETMVELHVERLPHPPPEERGRGASVAALAAAAAAAGLAVLFAAAASARSRTL